MREVIYKGRSRNPNHLIDPKAKALSPSKANKVSDLDQILTDWRHTRKMIVAEDPTCRMDDNNLVEDHAPGVRGRT